MESPRFPYPGDADRFWRVALTSLVGQLIVARRVACLAMRRRFVFNLRVRQMLMFPDPRPLVDRLGEEFFRQAPESPGVYLMRDATDVVLYVGKARNLRKRLNAYRVANPDRMARRHLRMLRAVVRIELQLCPDEPAALATESELLRALKPKFNRAGTWQGPPRYLLWRTSTQGFQLVVGKNPVVDWRAFGPLGSGASYLGAVLVRLLWFVVHPEAGFSGMPLGWVQSRLERETVVPTGALADEVSSSVEHLFAGHPTLFLAWLRARTPNDLHPFHAAALESDLEFLRDFRPLRQGDSSGMDLPV